MQSSTIDSIFNEAGKLVEPVKVSLVVKDDSHRSDLVMAVWRCQLMFQGNFT